MEAFAFAVAGPMGFIAVAFLKAAMVGVRALAVKVA